MRAGLAVQAGAQAGEGPERHVGSQVGHHTAGPAVAAAAAHGSRDIAHTAGYWRETVAAAEGRARERGQERVGA